MISSKDPCPAVPSIEATEENNLQAESSVGSGTQLGMLAFSMNDLELVLQTKQKQTSHLDHLPKQLRTIQIYLDN